MDPSNVRASSIQGEDSSGLAPDYKDLPAPLRHTVPDGSYSSSMFGGRIVRGWRDQGAPVASGCCRAWAPGAPGVGRAALTLAQT